MASQLASALQQVPELFWGLVLPVSVRCSHGGNCLFLSLYRRSQKDKTMKGKLPHGLRNAEHYLNAAEAQVISL